MNKPPNQIELQASLQEGQFDNKIQVDNTIDQNELEIGKRSTNDTEILNPLQQQQDDMDTKELFKKDFSNIILLNVLYLYQGLVISFFLEYTKNYLIQEKKIQGEQIALLRGILWPYSVKFLWAPLMDTYYFKSIGRRKTYVVPAQLIISLVLFYSSFFFESWMENIDVVSISTVGTICIFLLTIQDIAVDSWSVTLLHPKNVAYASFSQSFGQRMGNILGYQLFIYLSDDKLMKNVLNYDGKMLTPFSMCMMISLAVLFGTLFVMFFRKENGNNIEQNQEQQQHLYSNQLQNEDIDINEQQIQNQGQNQQQQQLQNEVEEEGFKTMLKNIFRFFKNKNILLLILFLLSNNFGTMCVDIPLEITLLNKGFSRSALATIELCLIPLTQIVSAYAARLSQKQLEFKIWLYCFGVKCIWNIGNYYVAYNFEEGQTQSYLIPIAVLSIVDTVLSTLPFIAISSFFLRMCDQSIGGTYITFLNSFSNFGRLWPSIIITTISSTLSLTTLFIIGSIYNIIIYAFWKSRSIQMQESNKQLWLIQKN